MNNNLIQVNDLYIFNMVPYMICKITAKTIFLKQCRSIREEEFCNNQTFQNYNPDVYQTYLPEMVDDCKMMKILKAKFDLENTEAKNIASKIELIKALIATLQETLNANTLTDLERLNIWNQKHKIQTRLNHYINKSDNYQKCCL